MAGVTITKMSKSYGAEAAAVSDLDLVIRDNSFVTLLGPSGCGKTTTLRLIAGYMKPDAGSIRVGERELSSPAGVVPPEHRGMGMVFQNYAVWPHKTVFENVVFGLRLRGVPRDKARTQVAAALAQVNLAGLDDRLPSQLSGGQQQRVSLARALVADPEVMLYDEPLSNLDARLRETMRTLLRTIHTRIRTTALYVTHDLTEAMVLSDRICVMNRGRIVQEATPRALYERPTDLFVTEFIGAVNVLAIEHADPARAEVRLQGGDRLRVAPWSRPDGTRLAVRHHHVTLLPAGAACDNALDVTVQDCVFLGDRVRFVLLTASGISLVAEAVAAPGLPGPGACVRAVLPAENCIVI
jgi:iron(III) transport system ATP-binding protein